MLLSMTSNRLDSIVQFLSAILIFIFVLAVTYFLTKFMAGVQKERMTSPNIEIVETFKLTASKYIQIVRIGGKYFSMVISKDTVTLLGEIDREDITISESGFGTAMSFKEILEKAKNKKPKK